MWIVLGVLAVIFVVAMCSAEKSSEPRVRGVIFVDPPAKKTSVFEIVFGWLLFGLAIYVGFLLLPYLLGAIGIAIAVAIAIHCFSDSK